MQICSDVSNNGVHMENNRGSPLLGRMVRKGLSEQGIFEIKSYEVGEKHLRQKEQNFAKTPPWETASCALHRN